MVIAVILCALAAAEGGASEPSVPDPAVAAVDSAPAPKRSRVLVTHTSGDLEPAKRVLLENLTATRLSRFSALQVVLQGDLEQRLGLEADKQLAGCEADAGCLAELAGAFDVDLVAVTSAGTLGGTTVFTLQLVDSHGGSAARGTANVSALDDIVAAVSDVVDSAGRTVTGDEPEDAVVVVDAASAAATAAAASQNAELRQGLLLAGGIGLGAGLVAASLGVIPAFLAGGAEGELRGLRVRYVDSGGDAAILDEAAAKQLDVDRARGLWNNAGIYAFWGGALITAAAAGALAAGVMMPEEGEAP